MAKKGNFPFIQKIKIFIEEKIYRAMQMEWNCFRN